MAELLSRWQQALRRLPKQAQQTLGVAVLLIAGLWLLLLLTMQQTRDNALLELRQSRLSLALAFQQHAASTLQLVDQALLVLRDDYTRTLQPPGIAQRLDVMQLDRSQVAVVTILRADGSVIETTNPDSTQNYADRAYFQHHAAVQDDQLLVGRPVLGRQSGKWRITLTRRINNPDGSFGGVVFAGLDPDWFLADMNETDLGMYSSVALIGLDGITRVRRNNGLVSYGEDSRQSQLFKEIPDSPNGSYVAKAASDGTLRVVGYSVTSGYPLVAIVASSVDEVMQRLRPVERNTWIAGVLLSVLLAALAWVLIARNIQQRQAMMLLQSSEARQRAIVDILPVPVGLSRGRGDASYLNAAFTNTFGYQVEDVPSFEDWCVEAFPDPLYRNWVLNAWREGLTRVDGTRSGFGPLELNVRCKDGSNKTVMASVTPLSFGSGGEYLAAYHDITSEVAAVRALQSALKDNMGLLNEVHHRVKNNLQVITSLLRLEASRSDKEEIRSVLQDMQGRVLTMSLLHESLYRSGQFAHVNLASYLQQLASLAMRALRTNDGFVQVHMDLSAIDVALDRAAPFGLLLNELLSNCMKHGFPQGGSGDIHILLAPVNGSPSAWQLRVRDSGVGLPPDIEARRSQSLGLQLVFDLTAQIGGKASLHNGPGGGAEFDLVFETIEMGANAANGVKP